MLYDFNKTSETYKIHASEEQTRKVIEYVSYFLAFNDKSFYFCMQICRYALFRAIFRTIDED